jgi:hypothetical protein
MLATPGAHAKSRQLPHRSSVIANDIYEIDLKLFQRRLTACQAARDFHQM